MNKMMTYVKKINNLYTKYGEGCTNIQECNTTNELENLKKPKEILVLHNILIKYVSLISNNFRYFDDHIGYNMQYGDKDCISMLDIWNSNLYFVAVDGSAVCDQIWKFAISQISTDDNLIESLSINKFSIFKDTFKDKQEMLLNIISEFYKEIVPKLINKKIDNELDSTILGESKLSQNSIFLRMDVLSILFKIGTNTYLNESKSEVKEVFKELNKKVVEKAFLYDKTYDDQVNVLVEKHGSDANLFFITGNGLPVELHVQDFETHEETLSWYLVDDPNLIQRALDNNAEIVEMSVNKINRLSFFMYKELGIMDNLYSGSW